MEYVILNLRSMFKNHLGILLLIIISEILTALCMLFSYGMIMQATDEYSKMNDDMRFYRFNIEGAEDLQPKINEFLESVSDIDYIIIDMTVKDKIGYKWKGTALQNYISTENNLSPYMCKLNESRKDLLEENGNVIIGGKEYKVTKIERDARKSYGFNNDIGADGSLGTESDFTFSAYSVPDGSVGREMIFYLTCKPTAEIVDHIKQTVKLVFGGETLYTPAPIDLMKKQETNTFYAYALIIVMIVVINLSMYFRYIVELRRKQIRIFTVSGATTENLNNIFLIENLIELVIGYAAALCIFRFGLFGLIKKYYPTFSEYYTLKMYLITFGIFVVGSLVIMMLLISPHIRKAASAGERSK